MIAWFGPRGLSSLLLILLPVFAGIPGSEQLFAICCLVVLLSVVVHGGSPMLLGHKWHRRERSAAPASDISLAPSVTPAPLSQEPSSNGPVSKHSPARSAPVTAATYETVTESSAPNQASRDGEPPVGSQSMSISELRDLWGTGVPVIVLDVRTDRTYDPSPSRARGALRLLPDHVAERAAEHNLPQEAWLIAYCA